MRAIGGGEENPGAVYRQVMTWIENMDTAKVRNETLTRLFLHNYKLQCHEHMGIYEGSLVCGIDSSGLLRVIGSMNKLHAFLSR